MAEVLSISEIDKLLGGDGKGLDDNCHHYDFEKPSCFLSAHLEGVRSEAEEFCKLAGATFSNALGKEVVFSVDSVEQLFYEDFLPSLSFPYAMFRFRNWQRKTIALRIQDTLMFSLLERFTPKEKAGDRYKKDKKGRFVNRFNYYDVAEYSTAKKIANLLLKKPLNRGLFKKTGLKFTFQNFQDKPDFLYASRCDELGIMVELDIKFDGDSFTGGIWIPQHALTGKEDRYLKDDFRKTLKERKINMGKNKLKNLDNAKIPLDVVIGETVMTIKELQALKENRVVILDRYIGEPVEIQAEGVTIAKGQIVAFEKNYGVKITDVRL